MELKFGTGTWVRRGLIKNGRRQLDDSWPYPFKVASSEIRLRHKTMDTSIKLKG